MSADVVVDQNLRFPTEKVATTADRVRHSLSSLPSTPYSSALAIARS